VRNWAADHSPAAALKALCGGAMRGGAGSRLGQVSRGLRGDLRKGAEISACAPE